VLTLSDIMDKMSEDICPKLAASEEFCDVLMGKLTPLLFPYLFPKLQAAIYVDRNIKFQASKSEITHFFTTLFTGRHWNIVPNDPEDAQDEGGLGLGPRANCQLHEGLRRMAESQSHDQVGSSAAR